MSKILWKSLLLSPGVLGATLLSVASVMAAPTPKITALETKLQQPSWCLPKSQLLPRQL